MKKLSLAFLWHQHQPVYKNPSSGIYELPWVRLHATKDYFDTAAILDEFPKIKMTFNLVPSLLTQLAEYSQGTARDRFMDLTLKPADELNVEEKCFILHNFFMANWETMVHPHPRYNQLLEKRGKNTSHEELKRIQSYFRAQDMRDLQVWFNLAWMDPYWRTKDELIALLFAKQKDFSEEDKQLLVKKQLEICGNIVSKYRQLQETGQIEVSTTPFYHPILPLLCDTNTASVAMPDVKLPKIRFQHKEDAKIQIQKAVEYYKRCFGRPPRGMWPSEGSVSDDVVSLFKEEGIEWIATDESILFKSLGETNIPRNKLFKPYELNISGNKLNIVFRDHGLSDLIGFVYSKWSPEAAATDFIKKLHAIADSVKDLPHNSLVTVILDGENCWEYYQNDGWDFLRYLYQALSNDPVIETTTISGFLDKEPNKETIKKIWPGSWINANYAIWLGHPEDNTAWDYLSETRKFLVNYTTRNPDKKESPEIEAAWEKIYIAEGSDWNWWYGDDHSSGNDEMFDYLFRQNLINVYELLKEKAPEYLYKSIKGIRHKEPSQEPIGLITPRIDGKITNYFEWQNAGSYKVGHSGGSMHQVETIISSFHYGFDLKNLYIRIDADLDIKTKLQGNDLSFRISFLSPAKKEAVLRLNTEGKIAEFCLKSGEIPNNLTDCAIGKIIELSIPLKTLEVDESAKDIEFVMIVEKDGLEIERWPFESSVIMTKPSEDFASKIWSV